MLYENTSKTLVPKTLYMMIVNRSNGNIHDMVPKAFLYFIMVVALTHDNLTTPDIHKKHS
jgi:hypothetical protein